MGKRVVVIVGGGFSGSLLALHLLRSGAGRHVHLIEKGPTFGRGKAYSTQQPDHLLNVRAGNMSAYSDQPAHFQNWLGERTVHPADPFTFAQRRLYGDYLQNEVSAAERGATAGRLTLLRGEAVDVQRAGGGLRVDLLAGETLVADTVVIATGHGAPTEAISLKIPFAADPAYIANPWLSAALDPIEPDDSVLLLGTGLTAVDVVASLDNRSHRGKITALSRRGLLPQTHARVDGEPLTWVRTPNERLSRSVARFRREAERLANWRRCFDGLRGVTQALWADLDEVERRRFLRHLRPWWDIHRHRMAPEIAARIDRHLASGRLCVAAGRLIALQAEAGAVAVTWRPRGQTGERADRTHWVINCAGAEGDPRSSSNPLIRRLLQRGLAKPDPLDLGLDADGESRLLDGSGLVQNDLFGIGPITRGAFWEVVAVPDLRIQAQHVAAAIAAGGG